MQLPTGIVLYFLTLGAFSKVLIWSNKADTAINTTIIADRLESRQGSNTFLDHFQGVLIDIWKNLWESVEGSLCEVVFYLECKYPKKKEIRFAYRLST